LEAKATFSPSGLTAGVMSSQSPAVMRVIGIFSGL
jgi:hypothetical protein